MKQETTSAPRFPARLLAVVVLVSAAVLVWLGSAVFLAYQGHRLERRIEFRVAELAGDILWYDEILTMSARMAAATGDMSWEARYRVHEKKLETALAEAESLSPESFGDHAAEETRKANDLLIHIESQVFDYVRDGKVDQARKLMEGDTYRVQKDRYRKGIVRFQQPQQDELLLEGLRSKILLYDEILTMSARMAAATGDSKWELRYRTFEPELDTALFEARVAAKAGEALAGTKETEEANRILIQMENEALGLVRQGRPKEALRLLTSNRYSIQKQIYADGMKRLADYLRHRASSSMAQAEAGAVLGMAAAGGAVILLGIMFFVAIKALTRWKLALADARDHLEFRVRERTEELANQIKAREQLQEALVESRKLEAIGTLASGIAHEFNNLMMVIGGSSQVLVQQLEGDDAARPLAEEILKSGERAAQLTSQLLAFSRKQMLEPELIDLNEVLIGAPAFLFDFAGDKTRIVTHPERGLGRIRVDPAQLNQILINLTTNARDAMQDGGTLTLEAENLYIEAEDDEKHPEVAPGSYVMLAISDTGAGMERTTMARMFEPFYSTKEQGKGTGLGLSTVLGIVKQSGGHIWIYSERGKGTTVKIVFPRVDAPAREDARDSPPAPYPRGSGSILIVDDEPGIRRLIARTLIRNGYDVREAKNGSEGLGMAVLDPPDLLITDAIMPEMTGPELAESLLREHPGVRVLYMSGYTENAIVHHGVVLEGIDFVRKPCSPKDILAKAREILER